MSLRTHIGFVAALSVFAAAAIVPPAVTAQTVAAKPTDANLADRIAFRLETNAAVRKYDLKVKVDDGIAMLSGQVATAAQKAEAARLAQVTGVRRVESDITVTPDADKTLTDRTKAGLNKTGAKIDDAWITTKVKWFFLGEDALKDSDINVDTKNNVVTLKGTVPSSAGKARAEVLAKDTEGVTRVVNDLTIGPKK
ncbi:MAG: BON domain-containing protein [Acidobacteriota bacterium]